MRSIRRFAFRAVLGFAGAFALCAWLFSLPPLPSVSIATLTAMLTGILGSLIRGKKRGSSRPLRAIAVRLAILVPLLCAKALWVGSVRVDYERGAPEAIREDLLERRAFLIERVADPDFGPNSLPAIYGEWSRQEFAIGTLSMAAAAMTNLAFAYPETRNEALAVVDGFAERLLKQDLRAYERFAWGRDPIESLASSAGQIGYLGHLNFVLGARRILGGDGRYGDLHAQVTGALARRMSERAFPYLETFPGMVFVPDNAVVVASIALFDRTEGGEHGELLADWVGYTRENLIDPQTQLIVARVDSGTGRPSGPARGSHAAWNSFYLPFVDPVFADEQYRNLRQHLAVELPLGLAAVREYPAGVSGYQDFDSGPIVAGLSTTGTALAMAGAHRAGDFGFLNGLLLSAEIAGSSVRTDRGRHYLVAPLVGEAMLLAMRTARDWDLRFVSPAD